MNFWETKMSRLLVCYSFNCIDLKSHLVSCLDNNFGYDLIQEYRVSQALCLLALEESLSIHVREGLVETSSCINSA